MSSSKKKEIKAVQEKFKEFLEDDVPTDPALDLLQITKNFHLKEMEINDQKLPEGGEIKSNAIFLLQQLQILRDYLGSPIKIISGFRTEETQRKLYEKDPINIAKTSQHCRGFAADIKVAGLTTARLADAIFMLESKGAFSCKPSVGIYPDFVHIDFRTKAGLPRARW